MEAIKHSRIIVVLLILYIGISILVVTLDNSNKNNKKSNNSSNDTKQNDTKYNDFISELNSITDEVVTFIGDNNITYDTCIKLSEVMGDDYSGSVYVSEYGESIKMWYSNGTYAVNNIETNQDDIQNEDIEDNYTTEYYNNCGLSE